MLLSTAPSRVRHRIGASHGTRKQTGDGSSFRARETGIPRRNQHDRKHGEHLQKEHGEIPCRPKTLIVYVAIAKGTIANAG